MKRAKQFQFDILAGLFLAILVCVLFCNTLFAPGELIYAKDASYLYPNEVVLEAAGFGADFPVWWRIDDENACAVVPFGKPARS